MDECPRIEEEKRMCQSQCRNAEETPRLTGSDQNSHLLLNTHYDFNDNAWDMGRCKVKMKCDDNSLNNERAHFPCPLTAKIKKNENKKLISTV